MRRLLSAFGLVLLISACVLPGNAYAQQSLNLNLGGFVPRGEDARVDGDVLFNDQNFFLFDLGAFKGGTFGAEWLIALNDRVEVGLGVGLYAKTVPSTYAQVVNLNGAEIEQRLKLRIAPFTASFRLLPFGRDAAVQPYIGAGVGVLSWRYTETGDFVDFDGFIFHDRFVGSGSTAAPLILGGLRFPIGRVDLGAEIRRQYGEGDLDPFDFAGATKVDLGGYSYLATVNIRF
jgi:hypothetical protein